MSCIDVNFSQVDVISRCWNISYIDIHVSYFASLIMWFHQMLVCLCAYQLNKFLWILFHIPWPWPWPWPWRTWKKSARHPLPECPMHLPSSSLKSHSGWHTLLKCNKTNHACLPPHWVRASKRGSQSVVSAKPLVGSPATVTVTVYLF